MKKISLNYSKVKEIHPDFKSGKEEDLDLTRLRTTITGRQVILGHLTSENSPSRLKKRASSDRAQSGTKRKETQQIKKRVSL